MRKTNLLKLTVLVVAVGLMVTLSGGVMAKTTINSGNSNTGAGSVNTINNNVSNTSSVNNSNTSNVQNNVNLNLNTGGNTSNNNTGGGSVTTGSINATVNVTTCVNSNGAKINCPTPSPAPGGGPMPTPTAAPGGGGGGSSSSGGGGSSAGSSGSGGGEVLGASTLPATGPALESWIMAEMALMAMIFGTLVVKKSYALELEQVRQERQHL